MIGKRVLTISDFVAQISKEFSHDTAFDCLGSTISFHQLEQFTALFASYLASNFKRGSKIAVHLPNVLATPIISLAVIRAGCVLVSLNPRATSGELKKQLDFIEPDMVITLDVIASCLLKITDKPCVLVRLGDLQYSRMRKILLNTIGLVKMSPCKPDNAKLFMVILSSQQRIKLPVVKSDDLAMLQITSGTTGGKPKAAELTHASILNCIHQVTIATSEIGLEPRMRMIASLPLYHIYSFIASYFCLSLGMEIALITNPTKIKSFIRILARKRFSLFIGISPLYQKLLASPQFKKIDFSALKIAISGGMSLPSFIADNWQQQTGVAITEGYGLTESTGVISLNNPCNPIAGTAGYALPETQIAILKEQKIHKAGTGELLFRGGQMMKGYWRNEQATEEIMYQNWMRTGDLVEIDGKGMIHILDRVKNIIIISGFNVCPTELEQVFSAMPGIKECAVVGTQVNHLEQIVLFVRAPNLSDQEIIDYGREKLSAYKMPSQIRRIESISRNTIGKILHYQLKGKL